MRIVRMSIAVAAACAVLHPSACRGAEDSLCVRFAGGAGGETITLSRGSVMAGALPVTLCGIERNESYRLELDGPGFERRAGTMRLEEAGARVSGIRFSAMARNAIVPGMGSVYAGRPAAAVADGVSIAASLLAFLVEQREYDHLRNRLDVLESLVASAGTVEEIARAQEAAYETSRLVNVQNQQRRRLAILCGALYGWQVVEPLFADSPPRSRPGLEEGAVLLSGTRESRAKAFLYSLVHPGRGQLYQGKRLRGFFFSTAAIVAGLATIDFQNRVDVAAAEYDICVERFEAAATVAEKNSLAAQCRLLWSDLEDERRDRAFSIAALAAVWSLSCADIFFGTGDAEASRYTLEVDARGASLAVRF